MTTDSPAHMFDYWYEDKGLEVALTEYYPDTLANNPRIANAWATIQNLKLMPEQEHMKFVRFMSKMAHRTIMDEFAKLAELEPQPWED